jgi:hypothetical protein
VFDAWTKQEHFKHWFGCRHSKLLACDIDLRVGGAYRFVMAGEDGRVHNMHGVYREIVPPSRLVFTQGYFTEGFVSGEALVTLTFERRDATAVLLNITVLLRLSIVASGGWGKGARRPSASATRAVEIVSPLNCRTPKCRSPLCRSSNCRRSHSRGLGEREGA